MKFSKQEVIQYVKEEDVKFIRLAFCDVFGKQKNVSIMPNELSRAFESGIAIDSSAIPGFGPDSHQDLLLHPAPETLALLPWRPEHGKVVRMYTGITYPDGRPFECDTRTLLKNAVRAADKAGFRFNVGIKQEFYIFKLDEDGAPTKIPYDNAAYMDIAPDDKGENIRREICLTLEQMGIYPERSYHEAGPGQNQINFRSSEPLGAADNAVTFQTVVKTVAHRNGLFSDFTPKPLEDKPGNSFQIDLSVEAKDGSDVFSHAVAGLLDRTRDMTAFLNPTENSYRRFGSHKAPVYISWSGENRSQLIRVLGGENRIAELRSPDPAANPYLAFALMIYASLYGIERKLELPPASEINLSKAETLVLAGFKTLPESLKTACRTAAESEFIKKHIPPEILDIYCR